MINSYKHIYPNLKAWEEAFIKRHITKISYTNIGEFSILPNKMVQELKKYDGIKMRHMYVASELVKILWAKNNFCSKQELLTNRPYACHMLKLRYYNLQKIFELSKDQLKEIVDDLVRHKLVHKKLINKVWHLAITKELMELFFSDQTTQYITKKKAKVTRGKINKGNIILHRWFKQIKTKAGQTDFNAITIISEAIYYSRFFENKNAMQSDPDDLDNLAMKQTKIFSKSDGIVPHFKNKHFIDKFGLSNAQINDATNRLIANNLLKINVEKSIVQRKVIKKPYYLVNFEKLTTESRLDFKFKTPKHLSESELAGFLDFTPPHTRIMCMREYGISETNIYRQVGIIQNNKEKDELVHKQSKKIQKCFRKAKPIIFFKKDLELLTQSMQPLGYEKQFLKHLLNKLATRYPELRFNSKAEFFAYFTRILLREKRDSKDVNSKTYFDTPITLKTILEPKFSSFKKRLFNLFDLTQLKKIKNLLNCLIKSGKVRYFNCLEGLANYLKKALLGSKSAQEIKHAYQNLPNAKKWVREKFLSSVEKVRDGSSTSHLRARIAAKIPSLTAYRLLNITLGCNASITGDTFLLPTFNIIYCNLLPLNIKQSILNDIKSIYGSFINKLKFVQIAKPDWIIKKEVEWQKKQELKKQELKKQQNLQKDPNQNSSSLKQTQDISKTEQVCFTSLEQKFIPEKYSHIADLLQNKLETNWRNLCDSQLLQNLDFALANIDSSSHSGFAIHKATSAVFQNNPAALDAFNAASWYKNNRTTNKFVIAAICQTFDMDTAKKILTSFAIIQNSSNEIFIKLRLKFDAIELFWRQIKQSLLSLIRTIFGPNTDVSILS